MFHIITIVFESLNKIWDYLLFSKADNLSLSTRENDRIIFVGTSPLNHAFW